MVLQQQDGGDGLVNAQSLILDPDDSELVEEGQGVKRKANSTQELPISRHQSNVVLNSFLEEVKEETLIESS